MTEIPLRSKAGHLFLEMDENWWLLDTGAPSSFGDPARVGLADREFEVAEGYMGLTPRKLTELVGVECVGLLGADVLGAFDHILDVAEETITISSDPLEVEGSHVPLEDYLGVPILGVELGGRESRMFFDTGAQYSYFQGEALSDFPQVGPVTDFYPGVGEFETDLHRVPGSIAGVAFELQCGRLPDLLGMTLMMAGTEGIVGNEILSGRTVGYFPRRGILVLGAVL